MHQKQPPAKVATASPGAGGGACSVPSPKTRCLEGAEVGASFDGWEAAREAGAGRGVSALVQAAEPSRIRSPRVRECAIARRLANLAPPSKSGAFASAFTGTPHALDLDVHGRIRKKAIGLLLLSAACGGASPEVETTGVGLCSGALVRLRVHHPADLTLSEGAPVDGLAKAGWLRLEIAEGPPTSTENCIAFWPEEKSMKPVLEGDPGPRRAPGVVTPDPDVDPS